MITFIATVEMVVSFVKKYRNIIILLLAISLVIGLGLYGRYKWIEYKINETRTEIQKKKGELEQSKAILETLQNQKKTDAVNEKIKEQEKQVKEKAEEFKEKVETGSENYNVQFEDAKKIYCDTYRDMGVNLRECQ